MPAELADPSPTDSPVGGGREYGDKFTPADADQTVSTKSQLVDAVEAMESRARDAPEYVIYIDDNAKIDMTGEHLLPLGNNVTLASGRGVDGSRGGLLYIRYKQWDTNPMFKSNSTNVRVSGLRAEGPSAQYFDPGSKDAMNARATEGFWLYGDNALVDNCQMYGWTHTAISIGARSYVPNNPRVRYCSIHNNQMEGYGYGVNVYNGNPVINQCYFDHNRHSIDGYGFKSCEYKASNNLVGSHPVDHAFDMHARMQNDDSYSGDVAGGEIIIEKNTFQFNTHHRSVNGEAEEGVKIRGRPEVGAYIRNNRFYHLEKPTTPDSHGQAYQQTMPEYSISDWENMYFSDNQYGTVCGEVGVKTPDQASRDQWHTVNLRGVYQDPVVIMKPVSYNGPHPCHVRLRNVSSESFEFQIEEWAYLDGTHGTNEFLSYIVLETGSQRANNGTLIEAGKTQLNTTFESISLDSNFNDRPVVLTQSQTALGPDPIVTRNKAVSSGGFDSRIQEEQQFSGTGHRLESVGYMAFEPGVIKLLSTRLEVGRTPAEVTDDWYRIDFQTTRESPALFADMQTFKGNHTCNLRFTNLNKNGVDIKVEEEQSETDETTHRNGESVGYVVSETKRSLL